MSDLQAEADKLVIEVDKFLKISPGPKILAHEMSDMKERFIEDFLSVAIGPMDERRKLIGDLWDARMKNSGGGYHHMYPNEIFIDLEEDIEQKVVHEIVHARLDYIRQGELDDKMFLKRRPAYKKKLFKYLEEGFCDFTTKEIVGLEEVNLVYMAARVQEMRTVARLSDEKDLKESVKDIERRFEEPFEDKKNFQEVIKRGLGLYFCLLTDRYLGREELLEIAIDPVLEHKRWFFGWNKYKVSQKDLKYPYDYVKGRLEGA